MEREDLREKCICQEKEISELKEKLKQSDKLLSRLIWAFSGAIDAKDEYTSGHSQRVAEYSWKIAKRMGKCREEQRNVYFAGLLHDIGKLGIPDAVINKPGKLTEEEYDMIKKHPVIGDNILATLEDMASLSVGARMHHERYDGGGYPEGLKEEEIPEIARIIAVADAYDAMTSKRSYRDALPQSVVRSEIVNGKGKQFDPEIAEVMLELMDEDIDYEMSGW